MSKAAIRIQDRLELSEITAALARAIDAPRHDRNERGARREVVDFILDLSGYVPTERLFDARLLEPSFGNGDFLLPVVERVVESWQHHHDGRVPTHADLSNTIRAVELHEATYLETAARLENHLEALGISRADARALAAAWLHRGDFEPVTRVTGTDPERHEEPAPEGYRKVGVHDLKHTFERRLAPQSIAG